MKRDCNGCSYHIFKIKIHFSLVRVLKNKKKKLALTLIYCHGQETWLDDSQKLIHIKQSRFCSFFHVGKFKNV